MGVNIIPDRDASGKLLNNNSPFGSKEVEAGKLFRRKHGFTSAEIADGASGEIKLIVPYNACKINELEVVNAKDGVDIDLKVHDTPTGTISATLAATGYTAIPSLMLNQFGFNVELPEGSYRDKSEYDADLIKDMEVRITVNNNTGAPITLKGNIVYHEIK